MTTPDLAGADLAAYKARWEARQHFRTVDAGGRLRCPGCLVPDGEYHQEGCDHEYCPHCGEQRVACGCRREIANDAFPALLATSAVLRERVAALEAERAALVATLTDRTYPCPCWVTDPDNPDRRKPCSNTVTVYLENAGPGDGTYPVFGGCSDHLDELSDGDYDNPRVAEVIGMRDERLRLRAALGAPAPDARQPGGEA